MANECSEEASDCSCKVWKKEFELKHFGFTNSKKENFYQSQFCQPGKLWFLFYRLFALMYMSVWLIFHAIHPSVQGTFHWHLTNWAEVIHVFYLLLAFVSSVYGWWLKNHKNSGNSTCSIDASSKRSDRLGILFQLHWLSFSITADIVVIVVVLFWALAAPTLSASAFKLPIIYHLHLVNLVLILIDIFLIAVPVRLLHAVYGAITALVYILATLILHWLGIVSDIYPGVLDWSGDVIKSAIFCVLGVALTFLSHLLVFGLYKLRMWLYRRRKNRAPPGPERPALMCIEGDGLIGDQRTENCAEVKV